MGLGNSLQTAQAAAGGGGIGGWVELGRTTLGSAGDNITVSSLADKRYYMCLAHPIASTACQSQIQLGSGSIDTGTNYSGRFSNAGGADGTTVNDTDISISDTNSTTGFEVAYIANLSGKEKLIQCWNALQSTAGAGTAPLRTESTGKWANTSNPLDIVNWFNRNANNYNTGSELVVLGWDPTDTHTSNFWQELASVELGGASSTLDSGTFTAKKYLWVQAYINATTVDTGLTFNGDTGTNYARRWSDDGGTDGTAVSGNNIQVDRGNSTQFLNMFIVNNSANEKLGMYHTGTQNTAGAGNAPARRELVFKWANTSSQITSMICTKKGSGTDLQAGSIIKVWGSD